MGPVLARLVGYIVIGALVCVAGTAMLVRRDQRNEQDEAAGRDIPAATPT